MFLLLAVTTELPAIFWQGVPVARCKDGASGNFLVGRSCGSL